MTDGKTQNAKKPTVLKTKDNETPLTEEQARNILQNYIKKAGELYQIRTYLEDGSITDAVYNAKMLKDLIDPEDIKLTIIETLYINEEPAKYTSIEEIAQLLNEFKELFTLEDFKPSIIKRAIKMIKQGDICIGYAEYGLNEYKKIINFTQDDLKPYLKERTAALIKIGLINDAATEVKKFNGSLTPEDLKPYVIEGIIDLIEDCRIKEAGYAITKFNKFLTPEDFKQFKPSVINAITKLIDNNLMDAVINAVTLFKLTEKELVNVLKKDYIDMGL